MIAALIDQLQRRRASRRADFIVLRELASVHGWAIAASATARARGWLGKRAVSAREAIVLMPCASVHTFAMRVSIDVIFVAAGLRIVSIRRGLKPWRAAFAPGAIAAIELGVGSSLASHLQPGLTLSEQLASWPTGEPR